MRKKSQKESKFILVHLEIFRVSVLITWEQDIQKIKKYIIKHAGSIPNDFIDVFNKTRQNANGITVNLGQDAFIWLKVRPKNSSEYGVLYHEIYHAVDSVAKSRGMEIEESEARAYIFEYIVNKCNQILWK